jgi:signal peptidase I
MDATPTRPRRPWVAVLLALLCNGLGHAYAGHVRLGVFLALGWLGALVIWALGLRIGPGGAAAGGVLVLAWWLGQAIHAGAVARRVTERPRSWLSRPLGIAGFYLVATVLYLGVRSSVQVVVQTAVQSSRSMVPTVVQGDAVVIAPGAPIERGAVVMHQVPGGRAGALLKRVVAVAGETVSIRGGRLWIDGKEVPLEPVPGPCIARFQSAGGVWEQEPCEEYRETIAGRAHPVYRSPGVIALGDLPEVEVPAGSVFVLGDARDHSQDSRHFGPVPEAMIVGRVVYVIYSAGPDGVRWGRVGEAVR